jgi:hypothetical protein
VIGSLAICTVGAVTAWLLFATYQTPAARECLARYRAAKSPADRARVEALVPRVPGNMGPEAHSCGFTRRTAQWWP